jgi:hypothetical protein
VGAHLSLLHLGEKENTAMRKLLLIGGAAALIAVPSAALAQTDEPVTETDPAAEEVVTTTTDKALHSQGTGVFRYEGSGGVTISVDGAVTVRDLSAAKDLVSTPSGFTTTKTKTSTKSKHGNWARYEGTGTLTLDGSQFQLKVRGTFTVDIDPTATHPATGKAWDWGKGETTLKGGVPWPFWSDQKIVLSAGPMAVDLFGRGAPRWFRDGEDGPKGHRGKHVTVRKVVITRKYVNGVKVASRRVVTERGWFKWHRRDPGATWRLNGPASGTVDIADIDGRVRVWDKSAAKDLAVTVPTGTTTTTLADGSVVYSGLRDAQVKLVGTGFRMKAVAWDVEGTFTPTASTLARSFVRGKGTFDTADFQDLRARKRDGARVLLQPVAPK